MIRNFGALPGEEGTSFQGARQDEAPATTRLEKVGPNGLRLEWTERGGELQRFTFEAKGSRGRYARGVVSAVPV